MVVAPSLLAALVPSADAAVLYRLWIGLDRGGGGDRLQPRFGVVEVGAIVADPEPRPGPIAQREVHPLRRAALHAGDELGVERRLQQRRGLGTARQLGVDDLVAVRTELARRVHLLEEVGVAEPLSVEQSRLVD